MNHVRECTIDDDDMRYTTVHHRFQVAQPGYELVDCFPSRAEAFERAERWDKHSGYERYTVEVFDLMAHHEAPDTWRLCADGWQIVHYRYDEREIEAAARE